MIFLPVIHSAIWRLKSEIWPDFAKSEILPKSGIWLFSFYYSDLRALFQISEGRFRNLLRNLDFVCKFNTVRQIPDFKISTPKGVGKLPRKAGRSTTHPWQFSWAEV